MCAPLPELLNKTFYFSLLLKKMLPKLLLLNVDSGEGIIINYTKLYFEVDLFDCFVFVCFLLVVL